VPSRLRPPDPAIAAVTRLDDQVDRAFDQLRGHPASDRLFYAASELADFSLLWHLVGAVRALRSDEPLRDLARFSIVMGGESLLVNGGVKSLFRRGRPVHEGVRPHRLRQPRTSSFPSGHASAAFVAASLLAEGSRAAPAYYAAAAVVASSRVYVRIHHASDVVAGAALGLVLGRAARKAWPRDRLAPWPLPAPEHPRAQVSEIRPGE
jgi:membrane-associated phospholipid phosphatase